MGKNLIIKGADFSLVAIDDTTSIGYEFDIVQGYYLYEGENRGNMRNDSQLGPKYVSTIKQKVLTDTLSISVDSEYLYRLVKFDTNRVYIGMENWQTESKEYDTSSFGYFGISIKRIDGSVLPVSENTGLTVYGTILD